MSGTTHLAQRCPCGRRRGGPATGSAGSNDRRAHDAPFPLSGDTRRAQTRRVFFCALRY